MFARLNFLFSTAMLSALLFYDVGRFLVFNMIGQLAPDLAPYVMAAYTLAALMLTVLVLAKTVIRLNAVSSAARGTRGRPASMFAQLIMCLAHLCALYAVYTAFSAGNGAQAWWPWLIAPLLYVLGLATAIYDWRRRAFQMAQSL
jgi:hypothetical protein